MTSGPALERAGDLAAMLSNLVEHDVLFIDEIHRIARPAEEMLYLAMEDFRVDVVVGKGPGATSIPLEVAPFTLVGATTRSGALTGPLRDRFGFTAHMDFYEPAELERVLTRSAGILGIELGGEAGAEIARRSRGTPRIANRLLRRVRDFAEVRADGVITRDVAKSALAVYDVDELGLDRLDRAVLTALTRSFGGGPVGCVDAGGRSRRRGHHRRGGVRAFPGAGRHDRPHSARQGRHPAGVDAPRDDAAPAGQRFRAAGTVRVVAIVSAAEPGEAGRHHRVGGRDDHCRIGIRGAGRVAARLHLHDGVADLDQQAHPCRIRHYAPRKPRPPSCWRSTRASTTFSWRSSPASGIGAIELGHKGIGAALIFAGVGSMAAAAVVLLASAPDKARAALTQGTFPAIAVVLLGDRDSQLARS